MLFTGCLFKSNKKSFSEVITIGKEYNGYFMNKKEFSIKFLNDSLFVINYPDHQLIFDYKRNNDTLSFYNKSDTLIFQNLTDTTFNFLATQRANVKESINSIFLLKFKK
jgi:hypothetical protein